MDLIKDKAAIQRLREAAERAKIELSSQASTQINLPFITADQDGPKHLDLHSLTRAKFEELTARIDLMERVEEAVCTDALEGCQARTRATSTRLSLVGGSTRMPQVQELVRKLSNKEPNRSVNPDEVVAVGAAMTRPSVLGGGEKSRTSSCWTITPAFSMGIVGETQGGIFDKLIDRNTTIPTKKSRVYTTAVDNQPEVEIHILQGERPMAQATTTA